MLVKNHDKSKHKSGIIGNTSVLEVELNNGKKVVFTPLINIKVLLDAKLEMFGTFDSG